MEAFQNYNQIQKLLPLPALTGNFYAYKCMIIVVMVFQKHKRSIEINGCADQTGLSKTNT